MERYEVVIQGTTPLMHHRMPDDELLGLLGSKTKIAKDSEARTPRQIAEKYVYKTAQNNCYIPSKYIQGAFKNAAGEYKQGNKSRKSVKAIAGAVFVVEQPVIEMIDDKGKVIKDFEVDLQKGTNHQKGAIAICRPRFDRWGAKFTVRVNNELLTAATAQQILQDAGTRAGIGSYRVTNSGSYGQFIVTQWKKIE